MKQTAVEWLEKEFVKLESTVGVHGIMYELIEKAIAMEKEQIVKARINGDENHSLIGEKRKEYAEQYYNETYNKL
jgi:hypothetical protein